MLPFLFASGGFGLMGLALVWFLHQLWPFEVLQISWQLSAINAFGQAALLILLAVLLLMMAQRIQVRLDRRRFRLVTLLRRMALFAVPVMLLCMPLQMIAGIRLQSQHNASEIQRPLQVKAAALAIAKAETPQALATALAQFPFAATQLNELLSKPLPQARALLLQELNPQISQADHHLKALLKSHSRHHFISRFLLSLNFLVLALGYAAIAQSSPGRPTLFQQLTWLPLYLFTGRAAPGEPARHPLPERWIQALQKESDSSFLRASPRSSESPRSSRPGPGGTDRRHSPTELARNQPDSYDDLF